MPVCIGSVCTSVDAIRLVGFKTKVGLTFVVPSTTVKVAGILPVCVPRVTATGMVPSMVITGPPMSLAASRTSEPLSPTRLIFLATMVGSPVTFSVLTTSVNISTPFAFPLILRISRFFSAAAILAAFSLFNRSNVLSISLASGDRPCSFWKNSTASSFDARFLE